MTTAPKKNIMPIIYALLPISTYKPTSTLGAIFMYPFTYPKTETGANELPGIMDNYFEDLLKSFPELYYKYIMNPVLLLISIMIIIIITITNNAKH